MKEKKLEAIVQNLENGDLSRVVQRGEQIVVAICFHLEFALKLAKEHLDQYRAYSEAIDGSAAPAAPIDDCYPLTDSQWRARLERGNPTNSS